MFVEPHAAPSSRQQLFREAIAPHTPFLIACALGALFAITFSWLSLARHAAYQSHAFDLGNVEQAMWNTIHGAPFRFTNQATAHDLITSRLAIHVEPILLLLASVYMLHPRPETLLIVQAVVVGAGAIPAYLLARAALQPATGGSWVALVFPLVYILDPSLQSAVLDDFHAVTLAAALIMFALYFGLYSDLRLFAVASVLAAATKEEVGLIVAVIGFIVLITRHQRIGALMAVGGIIWSLVAVTIIIPHFNPMGHSPYISRYHELGKNLNDILLNVIRHPHHLWSILTQASRLHYLAIVLLPVAYLALLAPLVMVAAVPELLLNMLSTKPEMYSGFYQYSADIVPIIIAAAAIGIVNLFTLFQRIERWLAPLRERRIAQRRRLHPVTEGVLPGLVPWPPSVLVLAAGLVVLLLSAFVRQYRDGFSPIAAGYSIPMIGSHQQLEDRLLTKVPARVPLSAGDEVNPHLANRRTLYLFPTTHVPGLPSARYVALDASIAARPIEPHTLQKAVAALLYQGWRVVVARDGILVLTANSRFSHRTSSQPLAPLQQSQHNAAVQRQSHQRGEGEHGRRDRHRLSSRQRVHRLTLSLPPAFYTFMYPNRPDPARRVHQRFGPLTLVGYTLHPRLGRVTWARPAVSVDSYWRLDRPTQADLHIAYLVSPVYQRGMPPLSRHWHAEWDSPTTAWLPPREWRLHRIVFVQTVAHTVDAEHPGHIAVFLVVYRGHSAFTGWVAPPLRLGTLVVGW
jgi:uncharacterized membrane protein